MTNSPDAVIPSIFHFVFGLKRQKHPFPLLNYLCLKSCIGVNRPEQIYFYYRHEPHGRYWDLIKDQLTLVPVGAMPLVAGHAYRNKEIAHYRYARHSDFIRLDKLLQHGGVYADMDTIFVNPLPKRLFEQQFVIGREETAATKASSLCNAFIMSRRNSEFGWLWLRRMEAEFDGAWSSHSGLLPQRLSEEHPGWLHVEPARSFHRHACTREGIRTLFEKTDSDFDGFYSMHLWHHMWASWWRRDYTRFHEGMPSEEFIRSVDTTYNLAARPFLPVEPHAPPVARKHDLGEPGLADVALTHLGLFLLARWAVVGEWRAVFCRLRRRRRFSIGDQDPLMTILLADDDALAAADAVVEVGAGNGVFSHICRLLGSRSVHSVRSGELPPRTLGDVLKGFARVKLLKLDCQGSAELSLLTNVQLRKVRRIIGTFLGRRRELTSALVSGGFTVTSFGADREDGWFEARNLRPE